MSDVSKSSIEHRGRPEASSTSNPKPRTQTPNPRVGHGARRERGDGVLRQRLLYRSPSPQHQGVRACVRVCVCLCVCVCVSYGIYRQIGDIKLLSLALSFYLAAYLSVHAHIKLHTRMHTRTGR